MMANAESEEHTSQGVWRVRDPDGHEWGPYTEEALKRKVDEGRISFEWPAWAGFGQVTTVREAIQRSDSGSRWLKEKQLVEELKALKVQRAKIYNRGRPIEDRLRDVLMEGPFATEAHGRISISEIAARQMQTWERAPGGVAIRNNQEGQPLLYVNWTRAQKAGPLHGTEFEIQDARVLNRIARDIDGFETSSNLTSIGGVSARWTVFDWKQLNSAWAEENEHESAKAAAATKQPFRSQTEKRMPVEPPVRTGQHLNAREQEERAEFLQREWEIEIQLEELRRQETIEPTGVDVEFRSPQRLSCADLLRLDGFQFEELIARIWQAQGFQVQVTPSAGDAGIDILALKEAGSNLLKVAIQCKNHKQRITRPEAQKLIGATSDPQYSQAVLISTSGFSKGCEEYAKQYGRLYLHDGQWVCNQLNKIGIQTPR